jgi:spermidine/putrescine transport system ATP-binding protein
VPLRGRPAPARGIAVLRPEDLRLGEDTAAAKLTGTVTDVINVGSHCMIHVDIGGHIVVARHGGIAPSGLGPGAAASLAFAPDCLHLIGERP